MDTLSLVLLFIITHTALRLCFAAPPLAPLLLDVHSDAPALHDFTFHLLALPHTVVRPDFSPCAYTMKVWRMCTMLKQLGLKHVLYANEGSETDCESMEQIFNTKLRQHYYGADSDWRAGGQFRFEGAEAKREYVNRVVRAIGRRRTGTDLLLVSFGYMHNTIADNTGLRAIEIGIGYNGSWAPYRVYESFAWLAAMTYAEDVNYYYTVIPNCYYPREFVNAVPSVAGKYIAFVGRIILRKGILVVLDILRNLPDDYTLHVAGQGNIDEYVAKNGQLKSRIIHHGVLTPVDRNNLLVGARALVTPTSYKEPFGGVMVEAQFLGVPVITTDHASMSETIWHGVTGFRCRTLRCFVAAVYEADTLSRERIVERARLTYACDRVKYQYRDYFQDVVNGFDRRGWGLLGGGAGKLLAQKQFYPCE